MSSSKSAKSVDRRIPMTRLFGTLVILGLSVLGLLLILLAANGLDNAFERQLNRLLEARVESSKQLLLRYTENRARVLGDLANSPPLIQAVMQPDTGLANAIDMLESVKLVGQRPRMILFDFEGRVLYDSSRFETCLPDPTVLRSLLMGENAKSMAFHQGCHEGPLETESFLRIIVPIIWRDRPEGLLAADIALSQMDVLEEINQGSPLEAMALLQNGVELYTPQKFPQGLRGWEEVPELGVQLRFSMDLSGVNRERDILLVALTAVVLLLVGLFGVLTYLIGRRLFVTPLAELQERADMVRQGLMPPPMRLHSPVLEITTLDEALLAMAKTVLAKHRELELQVHEREQVAQALLESKKLLAATGRTAKVGGWQINLESDELIWTEETYNIHELETTFHLTTESVLDFYPPEARASLTLALKRLMENDAPYDLELPFITAKGRQTWVRVRGELFRESSQPDLVIGTIQDITERKNAELALRESEEFNKRIIESSPDCIKVLDHEGRLRYMSPGGQKLLCIRDISSFMDMYYPDFFSAENRSLAEQALLSAKQGHTSSFQALSKDMEGTPHWWSISVTPLRSPDGELQRFLVVSRDISSLKQAQEKQRKAMEEAIAANKAKSEFLANMSHEIRTPMNGILGMAQLLADSPLTPDQQESLRTIESSANALLRLINDILDLSKIEAEKMELHTEPFRLQTLIREIAETLAPQAAQKALSLTWNVESGVPEVLVGDAKRLRQICINLLGNAVKFTEKGGVHIAVCCKSVPDDQKDPRSQELLFSVNDTGIGIPPEAMDKIFESFSQADGSSSRLHGGTGLGLSISQRLVALMGGVLEVQSTLGKGSTFSFKARFLVGDSAELPIEKTFDDTPFSAWGLLILVVDDNEINRLVARRMLERTGNTVHLATSGAEALELLQVNEYALVFMDVQMPLMDGLETTAAIRDADDLAGPGNVYIVAMTAHAMKGDKERFLEAGMNDYLPKPLSLENLQESLRRFMEWSLEQGRDIGSTLPLKRPSSLPEKTTQTPPDATPPAENHDQNRIAKLPSYEKASALKRFAGDEELYHDACQDYLHGSPEKFTALEQALEQGDFKTAVLHAHSLKGNSATVGVTRTSALAEQLETACRNESLPEARSLLQHTLAEFEAVKHLLS